jgi:hypothetical protein
MESNPRPSGLYHSATTNYEWVSIISGTGAAIGTAVLVARCTNIFWESVHKISHSWVDVMFSASFYLESCMWPDAISWWIRQPVCNKVGANRRCWWPVGPKLVFDQRAAPVPKIWDGSLHAIACLSSPTFTNERSYTVSYYKFNIRW